MLESHHILIIFIASLAAMVEVPAEAVAEPACADPVMSCGSPPAELGSASTSNETSTFEIQNWVPMMLGAPATVAEPGRPYEFQPVAFDPDGDPLEFRIANAPPWASFDLLTGRLSGTPTASDSGVSENIVIGVSDGTFVLELPPFSIEVLAPVPGSAVLSWVAPTQNSDGSELIDLAGFVVRYGLQPDFLDQEVRIPSPDVTGCELHELASGEWHFEVSAFNQAGLESVPSLRVQKTIS